MDMQFQRGQAVTVNVYGGKQVAMIVVDDRRDAVLICKPGEFKRAQSENRPPISIGVHREDISQAT